uniref:ORF3 n=1 Tax=Heterorhabditis bacteriophora TaxID=37862 RepID=A0A1I7WCW8_HETBA
MRKGLQREKGRLSPPLSTQRRLTKHSFHPGDSNHRKPPKTARITTQPPSNRSPWKSSQLEVEESDHSRDFPQHIHF